MILLLLGAPGSGKGTQSKFISAQFGIPQLSTGDILRNAVANKTKIGLEAKSYMDRGDLVPDSVMIGLVEERIAQPDCAKGFILDGFPRTTDQAVSLDNILASLNRGIDRALYFKLDTKILIDRITGRLIAPGSGKEYHEIFHPPKNPGVCDLTGEKLIRRPDDTEEKAKVRIKVFEDQTMPLVNYYEKAGLLSTLDAEKKISEINEDLQLLLTPLKTSA